VLTFNVAQLLKEPTGAFREHEIDESIEGLDKSFSPAGPLKGKVILLHAGRHNILVTGNFKIPLNLFCSRCLEPMVEIVEFQIEEEFKATMDVETGSHLAWDPAEVEESNLIDSSHILDLTEVIRQHIILNIPMKPLCKPDCLGLCPKCGHNLNYGPCGCKEEEIDPRLAILKTLKISLGGAGDGSTT